MIKMNECRIPRRGKGAKGTIVVKTFGVPKLNEDGIAKSFTYDFAKDLKLEDIIEAAKGIADINEALLRGLDYFNRSEAAQTQSASGFLAGKIWDNGLAIDKDEAMRLAMRWIQNMNFMASNDLEVPDNFIDILIAKRAKVVEKLKADGLWRKDEETEKTPRLVKPSEILNSEDSEDEEETE